MYQALRVRDREKRPQPTCKKHRSKYPLRKKPASMSENKKKEYFEKRKKELLKRKEGRKKTNTNACKHIVSEKSNCRKKTKEIHRKTKKTPQQIIHTKKSPPNKETIARRKANAKQRLIKRRIKKIHAFALRNGADPIKLIALMVSDMGAKHLPVSKYQKIALVS